MGLGERKQKVIEYNSQGLVLQKAMSIAQLSKHQYYYQPRKGKPGVKPSKVTLCYSQDKLLTVDNQQLVEKIRELHDNPDFAYGYHGTTKALQLEGFKINHKKVYRLMKENNLLKDKRLFETKNYVKYRKVKPIRPLEVIEMDIKMVWVERERRHAFILNILDTFNRKWLYQSVSFSIKKHQVKQAWEYIIEHYLQPENMLEEELHIEIRNDNDKRFSAKLVQDFFKENSLNQVFTHPYTPQENGHVESFHAILSQHLKRFSFWSLEELEQDLTVFQEAYNNQRLHGSLAHLAPNDFDALWHLKLIEMSSNIKSRKIKFKLKIPRSQVKQHTGNHEPEVVSLLDFEKIEKEKRASAPTNSNNLRCKHSPSVVPCNANV